MTAALDALLDSAEPSVRWKVRVHVLGEDPGSRPIRRLQREIRQSPRARRLLEGHAEQRPDTYAKWQGGHWVLAALADLGYPGGDEDLLPLRDEVLDTWLAERYFREFEAASTASASKRDAVPVVQGRHRRCASQQGSALLSVVRLGLDDGRAGQLVERLLHWQWPDGGWNCDRKPDAALSSVYETLLPMRGLAAFGAENDDLAARAAARRAAEVLLERRVVFHRSTDRLIHRDWAKLHYPVYWHYDVLAALTGLAEAGVVQDERCHDALDLLERARLADGGWPAQGRYYRGVGGAGRQRDHADWGGVAARRMNEWVTADTLAVLRAAGR